jgi:hypothetical protein
MSQNYRIKDIEEAIAYIEEYLSGNITPGDAAAWGVMKMSSEAYKDESFIQDRILSNAYAAVMMLSENEPEEFRSTKEDLEQVLSYLLGKEPFPEDRIPPSPKLS